MPGQAYLLVTLALLALVPLLLTSSESRFVTGGFNIIYRNFVKPHGRMICLLSCKEVDRALDSFCYNLSNKDPSRCMTLFKACEIKETALLD